METTQKFINMLTLWKPPFISIGRFSASKPPAAVVVMAAELFYHK